MPLGHSVSIWLASPQACASFTKASNLSYETDHEFLQEYFGKTKTSITRADRIAAEDALARWNFANVYSVTGLNVNNNILPLGPNIKP
jgi:hypothetical protein